MHARTTATRRSAALLFLAILGSLVTASPGSAQISPQCTDAEYRELDFWVGVWEVRSPDGSVQGTSRITPIMEGCAIQEEWSSSRIRGRSISTYNKPGGRWEQLWVDNLGVVLRQTGGWTGSAFHWQAERRGSDGVIRQLRVTLTPMEGGGVRQLQERSEDEGVTWSVIFDGRYHRVETTGG